MPSAHAFWTESVKRIPFVIIVFLIMILIQVFMNSSVIRQNSETNQQLLQRVASLSADNKRLSEQNNRLSQQNATNILCFGKLFAQYSRGEGIVQDEDLKDCVATAGLIVAPTSGTAASGSLPSANSTFPTNNSFQPQRTPDPSSSNPTTPTSQNTSPQNPSLITVPTIKAPCVQIGLISVC